METAAGVEDGCPFTLTANKAAYNAQTKAIFQIRFTKIYF
jgi:hypothetical protein